MAVTKDEILDAISKMSVMEVVELIADMEKKFNVTAAAAVAVAAGGGGGAAAAAPAAEAQTEFTVTLTEFGANKVGVIKVIREITGLGPQGGEGPGRRRTVDRQGRRPEDGCRDDQEEARGRRRKGCHQVVIAVILRRFAPVLRGRKRPRRTSFVKYAQALRAGSTGSKTTPSFEFKRRAQSPMTIYFGA